jgi:hypothetical protein
VEKNPVKMEKNQVCVEKNPVKMEKHIAWIHMQRGGVFGIAEEDEAMHFYRLMMEQRSWSSRVEALQKIIMIREEIYLKWKNDEAV